MRPNFPLNCRLLELFILYSKICSFTPVFFIRTVLDSFYLVIFYLEKFSTWIRRMLFAICRLPYMGSQNSPPYINVVILFTNTTFRCKMLSEDVVLVDRWGFKSLGKNILLTLKVKSHCQELTLYPLQILFVLAGMNCAIIPCWPLNLARCFFHRQTLNLW